MGPADCLWVLRSGAIIQTSSRRIHKKGSQSAPLGRKSGGWGTLTCSCMLFYTFRNFVLHTYDITITEVGYITVIQRCSLATTPGLMLPGTPSASPGFPTPPEPLLGLVQALLAHPCLPARPQRGLESQEESSSELRHVTWVPSLYPSTCPLAHL